MVFYRWFNRRKNSTVNWLLYVRSTRSMLNKRSGFVVVFTQAVAKANNAFWLFAISLLPSKRLLLSMRMWAKRWWNSWQGKTTIVNGRSPLRFLSIQHLERKHHWCGRWSDSHTVTDWVVFTEECGVTIEEGNERFSGPVDEWPILFEFRSSWSAQLSLVYHYWLKMRCDRMIQTVKMFTLLMPIKRPDWTTVWSICEWDFRVAETMSLYRPLLDEHRRIKLSTVLRPVSANSFAIPSMRKVSWKFTPRR